MRVLALDQSSTTTGVAIGSSSDDMRGGYVFGSITLPKSPEFGEKLAHLFRELDKLILKHQPDLIAYEMPFFPVDSAAFKPPKPGVERLLAIGDGEKPASRKARFSIDTAKALQKVAGCVSTIAALHGIPVEEYAAASWRKSVLGYGRMPSGADPKKVVRDRMRALGYEVTNFDQSDALGILMHAFTGPEAAARAQGDLLARVSL